MENIKKNRKLLLNDIKVCHLNSKFKQSTTPKLVAVSKKQDEYKIDTAIHIGQRIFGENRVQEAQKRWEERLKYYFDLELRLIGPLQTNKVKQALNLFDIIETIDREKLAKEIYANFDSEVKTKSFFIQINTGSEPQKGGFLPLEADSFIKYCKNELKLPIVGLMCIPPYNEESAMHFSLLKKIAKRNNLSELSMGMSDDFKEGIKFGATSVRIGSKFFGERTILS
ncbi:YggS family pyridoxal phosphate-dependent enzyme [bacterium]|nr:YggS family pyridoxal phosphate-dependent enzyme [bacterium]